MRIRNGNGTLNAYEINGHEIQSNDLYGYKIVAIICNDKSWCAFRGSTDWEDVSVARNGDEIPYEVAKYLFSTLANSLSEYGNLQIKVPFY